jgi:hypothetical protein
MTQPWMPPASNSKEETEKRWREGKKMVSKKRITVVELMEEGAIGCCIGTWEGSETVIELIVSLGGSLQDFCFN